MPAIYGKLTAGALFVEGSYGYGRHDVRTVRGINVGAPARQAAAEYQADQYSGVVRVGVGLPTRSADRPV